MRINNYIKTNLTVCENIAKHKRIDKKWGYELIYANNKEHNYCGKLLHINQGNSFSLHFHIKKHETFLILKGPVECIIYNTIKNEPKKITLKTGETLSLPPGTPHSLFAKDNDVDIIEFSSYHEDADSYRCGKFDESL